MALDRQKSLQNVDRLIKQGKVPAAIAELKSIAAAAPNDLLTLNRLGDVLAKHGRNPEAIETYDRIAVQFVRGGFYPKAIAIYKKILRIDANHLGALVQLGELYHQQKLPGEARGYFLRAAELYLQARNFAQARGVYERLVSVEPEDPRHRARLAETRAAEGETSRAGEELLALGETLLAAGRHDDARQSFSRAAELIPDRIEPVVAIGRSMAAAGRESEALAFLDRAEGERGVSPALLGERIRLAVKIGRIDEALDWLKTPVAAELPVDVLVEVVRSQIPSGRLDDVWERLDKRLEVWMERDRVRVDRILERIADIEADGHLPALERLATLRERSVDAAGYAAALDRLAHAYGVAGRAEDARNVVERFKTLGASPPAAASTARSDRASEDERIPEAPRPSSAEAPAIPLNRADEEFVAGRLTQAEILEKYGLQGQAIEQLREVTSRFPGLVAAQERLCQTLRESGGDGNAIQAALIALAVARRAEGNLEGAKLATEEARAIGELPAEAEDTLARLGLTDRPRSAATAPEPSPRRVEASAEIARPSGAVTIDFDAPDDEEDQGPPTSAEAAVVPSVAPPSPERDLVGEVGALLDAGRVDEASRHLAALRTLGYQGDAIEELARRVAAVSSAEPAASNPAPTDGFDDDDLSAITAALEDETFEATEAESEQSMAEVFEEFKRQVDLEVGANDHRTHYDLGIGFKEMGLLEQAVEQFRRVVSSPELGRESWTMLALCHRELGEVSEAVSCYRRAVELCGEDHASVNGLRYELAETILESGDRDGALDEFRQVFDHDPGFRDVRERIAELESCAS